MMNTLKEKKIKMLKAVAKFYLSKFRTQQTYKITERIFMVENLLKFLLEDDEQEAAGLLEKAVKTGVVIAFESGVVLQEAQNKALTEIQRVIPIKHNAENQNNLNDIVDKISEKELQQLKDYTIGDA